MEFVKGSGQDDGMGRRKVDRMTGWVGESGQDDGMGGGELDKMTGWMGFSKIHCS